MVLLADGNTPMDKGSRDRPPVIMSAFYVLWIANEKTFLAMNHKATNFACSCELKHVGQSFASMR